MADIVDRLRGSSPSIPTMRDGADEIMRLLRRIEALVTERDQLRAVLSDALPFIDDAADAHEVMNESAASDACREIVSRARSLLGHDHER